MGAAIFKGHFSNCSVRQGKGRNKERRNKEIILSITLNSRFCWWVYLLSWRYNTKRKYYIPMLLSKNLLKKLFFENVFSPGGKSWTYTWILSETVFQKLLEGSPGNNFRDAATSQPLGNIPIFSVSKIGKIGKIYRANFRKSLNLFKHRHVIHHFNDIFV